MKRRFAACLLLLALQSWAQTGQPTDASQAQLGGLHAHISLTGVGDCVAEAVLLDEVRGRLTESSLGSADDAEVLVEVAIEPSFSATSPLVARIEMRTPAGRLLGARELESPEPGCDSLQSALVFVLALAIESPALREAVAQERPPADAPPSDGATHAGAAQPGQLAPMEVSDDEQQRPTAVPHGHAQWEFGGQVAALVGALPAPTLGAGPYVQLAGSGFGLRGEFSAYLPQVARDQDWPDAGPPPSANAFWADVVVLGCRHVLGKGGWSAQLCAGGAVGPLTGRGHHLDHSRTTLQLDAALVGRLLVTRRAGRTTFGASAGGGAWLRRHDLIYGDGTGGAAVLFERPPFLGSFLLTVGWRL